MTSSGGSGCLLGAHDGFAPRANNDLSRSLKCGICPIHTSKAKVRKEALARYADAGCRCIRRLKKSKRGEKQRRGLRMASTVKSAALMGTSFAALRMV